MRRARGPLSIAFFGFAVGCARQPFTLPASGGPPWTEARSEHFEVLSDHGPAATRELTVALERIYAAFQTVAYPRSEPLRTRVHVVAFERQDEYQQYAGRAARGSMHTKFTPFGVERRIMFAQGWNQKTREIVQHELSHRFMAFHHPSAPLWLHEGMAVYLSSLEVRDGQVRLGLAPETVRSVTHLASTGGGLSRNSALPSPDALLSMSRDVFYASWAGPQDPQGPYARHLNYRGAWSLVHVLMSDDVLRPRFDEYLTYLTRRDVDAQESWQSAYRYFDYQTLEKSYENFERSSSLRTLVVDFTLPTAAKVRTRTLPDAEVLVAWARAHDYSRAATRDQAVRYLERALDLAPDLPRARIERGRLHLITGQLSAARSDFARALTTDPKSAGALHGILLVDVLQNLTPEGQLPASKLSTDLTERLSNAAETPEQHAFAARCKLYQEDFEAARRALDKALRLDSSCSLCWQTASELYSSQGATSLAIQALRAAIALLADAPVPPEVLARLETLERGRTAP